jgi:hypothetical protein
MMPRYYFNLSDGHFIPDNEGAPCLTQKDARAYAKRIAAEYGRNRDYIPDNMCVCVTDEMGTEVFRTPVVDHSVKFTAADIQHTLRSENADE